jgi:hypothetical protein
MPAISGSIFRRTLREQHRAQKYKAGKSDSPVVPMVQVCFYAVYPLIFPFTLYLFFYPRNSIFWDSSMQYNLLVASTSLRRTNGRLPAHGRVCGYSMRYVSSAPLLPTPTPASFISPMSFLGHLFRLCHCERTHHAPVVAIQNRNRSRVAPYIPMRSLMAFVAGSDDCVVPGSSCSIDVLCTWAACAPTGAQSISFCPLHSYGLHWP